MEPHLIWKLVFLYMIGGSLFSLLLEASMRSADMEDDATLMNRITIFVLWPISLFVYIVSFIMAVFNHFKND